VCPTILPENVEVEGDVADEGGGRFKGEGAFREPTSLGECVPATDRAAVTAAFVEMVGREKF